MPKSPYFSNFRSRWVMTWIGLIGLLGLTAWVPPPTPGSLSWSPETIQSQREALLANLEPASSPAPAKAPRSVFHLPVTVTGYSSTVDQTDDSPFITAMNTPVRPGILALSRDLLREFTPGAPFRFGDVVELEGVGLFQVEDTMNPRYMKRVDIWFGSREAARQWGRRTLYLAKLTPLAQASIYMAQAGDADFEPAIAD